MTMTAGDNQSIGSIRFALPSRWTTNNNVVYWCTLPSALSTTNRPATAEDGVRVAHSGWIDHPGLAADLF
jgi:hypothetical protein